MRKIILIIFLGLEVYSLFGKDIEVCATCTYSTIHAGVEAANSGDKVIVQAGLYKEHNINITQPIDLLAQGEVIVDGENTETIFRFSVDSFSIDGFTIINVGHSFTKEFAGILVHRSEHFTIKNNTLREVFFGILIEKSKYGIIENNKVFGNGKEEADSGNGVHIWHSSHMKVRGNQLTQLRDGIYFEFVTKSKISDNLSFGNIRYGLHFMFSNHDEYFDNTFRNNGAGVAVMFSKRINMRHNTFKDNWGAASYGLLLKEIYDAEIIGNHFIRNTTGVTAEGSTRINYKNNNFDNNGWAVKVTGACYLNIFIHNNFTNNSFDLSYNGQLNNNKFENNYWSAYTGYDLDKNGIGDVAFRPVKLFSYIVNKTPETIVLLRSLFVDVINFSEKVSPVFTPDKLKDERPAMKPFRNDEQID